MRLSVPNDPPTASSGDVCVRITSREETLWLASGVSPVARSRESPQVSGLALSLVAVDRVLFEYVVDMLRRVALASGSRRLPQAVLSESEAFENERLTRGFRASSRWVRPFSSQKKAEPKVTPQAGRARAVRVGAALALGLRGDGRRASSQPFGASEEKSWAKLTN